MKPRPTTDAERKVKDTTLREILVLFIYGPFIFEFRLP